MGVLVRILGMVCEEILIWQLAEVEPSIITGGYKDCYMKK